MILALLFTLRAPGSVVGLEPSSNADLLDSGVVVVRDFDNRFEKPNREILYLIRTDCGPYGEDAPDGVATRWDDRWKSVDAFEVRGPRELVITVEDPDGSWDRSCRITQVLSCYAPHADIWLDDAPAADGGLAESASWDEAVESIDAWTDPGPFPCTRARVKKTKAGFVFET